MDARREMFPFLDSAISVCLKPSEKFLSWDESHDGLKKIHSTLHLETVMAFTGDFGLLSSKRGLGVDLEAFNFTPLSDGNELPLLIQGLYITAILKMDTATLTSPKQEVNNESKLSLFQLRGK